MRSLFPGHFRPTENDFKSLWDSCIFAVDANVLLNLYRYSQETRVALEDAIKSISGRIFLPHQAAKEYLKNRLIVTASQAEEYTKAIKSITDLSSILANRKKHPFLHEDELPKFNQQVENLIEQLDAQRATLLKRLTNDEILDFIEKLSSTRQVTHIPKNQLPSSLRRVNFDTRMRFRPDTRTQRRTPKMIHPENLAT